MDSVTFIYRVRVIEGEFQGSGIYPRLIRKKRTIALNEHTKLKREEEEQEEGGYGTSPLSISSPRVMRTLLTQITSD
jgi:hypothetical protein